MLCYIIASRSVLRRCIICYSEPCGVSDIESVNIEMYFDMVCVDPEAMCYILVV